MTADTLHYADRGYQARRGVWRRTMPVMRCRHRRGAGALATGSLWAAISLAAPKLRVAAADRDDVDAVRIDWAAGRVTAGGTGIADRHAPSPAVALGTSRRGADEAAKRRISAKLGSLPLAAGGTLADKLADRSIQARIDAAVDAAITIDAEPETDGSWQVMLAVPLEAIRQALGEPRALPPTGDSGPPIVVVEGVAAKPAIGWTIAGIAAATLWVKDVPSWAKDAPRVRARSAKDGAIAIDAAPGTAATLYVLVGKS
jgi:hypothetical protein